MQASNQEKSRESRPCSWPLADISAFWPVHSPRTLNIGPTAQETQHTSPLAITTLKLKKLS